MKSALEYLHGIAFAIFPVFFPAPKQKRKPTEIEILEAAVSLIRERVLEANVDHIDATARLHGLEKQLAMLEHLLDLHTGEGI